jgi:deoxyribose-phosphate aldolase
MKNLNRFIDHTLLKQDATKSQIEELCQEALKNHFFSVCINPVYVSYAHKTLLGSDVCVCTVIGFPLGANTSASKVFETKNAIENGASEIDMVINVGAIKSKDWKIVEDEIRAIKTACGEKVLKVILETCLLTNDEKIMACQVAERAGADFVKTSTGFSSGGATLEDIHLMRKNCTERVAIKASGGVRDLKTAEAMIAAGATRLGTSSGVLLMKGLENVSGSY